MVPQRLVGLEQCFRRNGNRSYKEVVMANKLPKEMRDAAIEIRGGQ